MWATVLFTAILIVMAIIMIYPLLLVLNVSLKSREEFLMNPSGLFTFKSFSELFGNYSDAFKR